MLNKRYLFLALVLVLAIAGFVVAQDDMGGMDDMGPSVMLAPDEPIRLGYAGTLSGEGLVQYGTDILRGVELALEDRPTVTVDGVEFPIQIDAQDDLCSPEGGQTVANRFVSDETIVGVVGPMCSSACEAAIPIFDDASFTSISASCTAVRLTANESFSFNRTVTNDDFQGVVTAEFMFNELGVERIALIDDSSAYGTGLADVIAEQFEALGGEVVSRESLTVGDTDFRALLEDIALDDPQLIHFSGFIAEGARLLSQRFDAALEDLPFMSADGLFSPEIIETAGADADSLYVTTPQAEQGEALEAFLTRYVETYGEQPGSPYNTNGYDATNLLLDAIEAVGYIDDNGDLVIERAALQAYVRSAELDGLTSDFACDGTGECAIAGIAVYQVVDGAFELVQQ